MMQGLKVSCCIALLVVVASCGGGNRSPTASLAPLDPASAVRGFMTAAETQNISMMAGLWGTRDGLAADRMEQDVLVRRLTVIMTYLQHDRYELSDVSEAMLQSENQRIITVRMWHQGCRSEFPFTLVRADEGWLVQGVDLGSITSPARHCQDGS